MRILFIITILSTISTLKAHASIPFESIELIDSSVINSSEISSVNVNLNNDGAFVDTVETKYGEIINGNLIKKINKSNISNPKFQNQLRAVRVGGEGSGG